MRPRSRLLAKRGLPTIREGYEELVQDLNQTNSQHTSTQDYFHSIRQLARPTFPLHEPDHDILSLASLDSSKPCLRLHRLRQPLPLQLQLPLTTSSRTLTTSQPSVHREESEPERAQGPEPSTSDRPGSADPLEYLYSHGGAAAAATRRGRPGPEGQRKSSCPELLGVADSVPSPTVLQRSPVSRKKLDDGIRSSIPAKLDGAPAGWRGKSSSCCMDKQTMVSHWIAECRSAWREARIRACMLPVIAEK